MHARAENSRRSWIPPAAFVGVLLVFGSFWYLLGRVERSKVVQATQLSADQASRRLESFVGTRLALVEVLRRSIESGSILSVDGFRARAETYQQRFAGIVAINWVDADGVIREVVPLEPNRAALGKNLFDKPNAAPTIRAASRDAALHVTPLLELYQGGTGFAVYGATAEGSPLEGFVNAALRVSPVIEQALGVDEDAAFDVEIADGDRRISMTRREAGSEIVASSGLDVGDRRWTLTLAPRPQTVARFDSPARDLVLPAGVVSASIVAWLVWVLIERRERERHSSERYRRLVEDMPALVCRWLPDTTLTFVNTAYVEYFAREGEELVGRRFIEMVPDDMRDDVREMARALSSGERRSFAHEQAALDASGRRRFQEWRNRALTDDTGRVVEIQSIGIDTTERHRAEEALGVSEQRFRAVFASVNDAILILDEAGRNVVDVNESAMRLYDADRAELVGTEPLRLIHGEPPPELMQWFGIDGSERVPIRLEWRATRGGSLWWVAANLSMARIDGADRVLCVVRDVSEQKMLAEQLRQSQRLEAVGTLASGLAHDVNNVMTAIIGHAEQAHRRLDDRSKLVSSLESIVDVCRQAGSTTRSLLTFGRHGSTTTPESIDLRSATRHAVGLLRPLLPDAITVELDDDGPPVWVRIDRTQLQQVVMNLVLNARDAMLGGGRLAVAVDARHVSDTEVAVLSVRDDGRGMAAEVQRRVIEPFFTTKARGQGTGLGMSIVHGIVSAQGGTLSIESSEGRGTTVGITLPRCPAPPEAVSAERTSRPALAPAKSAAGAVLLIEDNAPVREVLAHGLAAQGYDVLQERDGEAGLRVFEHEAERLSLVVVDVDLPRKAGPECVREMQRLRGDVPTILISGNSRQSVDFELGSRVEFLQKPFRIAQLAELGQRMIDDARNESS